MVVDGKGSKEMLPANMNGAGIQLYSSPLFCGLSRALRMQAWALKGACKLQGRG